VYKTPAQLRYVDSYIINPFFSKIMILFFCVFVLVPVGVACFRDGTADQIVTTTATASPVVSPTNASGGRGAERGGRSRRQQY
jgi:hypothetical protein